MIKPKKKVLPSMTTVRKVLMSCLFDPRAEQTPFHNIAMTAGPDYLHNRAMELIKEGVEAFDINGDTETYHDRMQLAIGLLALAKAEMPVVDEK